ncbi:MAG: hypothetical protein QM831_02945 [Kofleriaceae bacterium]
MVALWISVAAIVAYWTLWFVDRSIVASMDSVPYNAFENAFPTADAWLAIAASAAAISIQRDLPRKAFWIIATGSASFYLTAMDVTWDLENRVYAVGGPAVPEMVINLASAALTIWTLRVGWKLLQDADA